MKFKEIFEGNNSAYGIMKMTGEVTDKGKAVAKAYIKRESITDELWQDHLDGKDPALGVIPINEDNECKWGCIDVDEYNLDHKNISARIKSHKLPLVNFRSKSGGAHLFLFAKEFIPASLMQSKLKTMAEALGFAGSEIFPKQTVIHVEKGDTGNFLNLPYHGGVRGLRYTFDESGNAASLESFYSMYDEWAQTKKQIEMIEIKEKSKSEEAFKDGPPCLNRLAAEGFGEGSRNNALFNIAIYCRKAFDDWENKVGDYNQKYMTPPLTYSEVQTVIKSIGKKQYENYRCKDQPIESVCQPRACSKCKFGVGYNEEQMPELGTLSKICSSPSQYFLDVDGKRVELTKEQLHNANLFAIEVMDKAGVVIGTIPKGPDWRELYLKPLMSGIQEIEPLKSLDPTEVLVHLLEQFTVNRTQARTRDDILRKMAWTEDGFCYFRMEDFFNFCKRNNWEFDRTKTGNLLKGLKMFEKEVRLKVKDQSPHLIKIKAMKITDPTISEVKYQETPF